MNHDITVTADVLLTVTCSCGERLLEVKSASFDLLEQVAAEHLEKTRPIVDYTGLYEGMYIHGLCNSSDCLWCSTFPEKEACD